MLVHHGTQTYQEAASAAAAHAREKLGALIETGRNRAGAVIAQVQEQLPQDAVVRSRALQFHPRAMDGAGPPIALHWDGVAPRPMHDHALAQAAERTGLPWRYVQELRATDWGRELVAHNLNRLAEHQTARYLVRSVGTNGTTQVRGILSDRYRRLDSRPIIDSFCRAADRIGAVPVEGYALETKVAIKALLPRLFEPVPNEVIAFGVVLSNSDFGDGALSLRCFMLRLFCTNYAITDEALRQVHLGGQLASDVAFSDRTFRLDTSRSASMISDLVAGELGPGRIDQACSLIARANDEKVGPTQVAAFLKKHLGVGDAEEVSRAFSSADVENMPAGQTAWRLSNAVSWIAGQTKDEGKRLDLMKVAALALPGAGQLHAPGVN